VKWRPGQKVVVIHGHANGANESATIVRECRYPENRGKWLVNIEGVELAVEDERLVDEVAFWDKFHGRSVPRGTTAH
jgi:hypothetical protein